MVNCTYQAQNQHHQLLHLLKYDQLLHLPWYYHNLDILFHDVSDHHQVFSVHK